MTTTDWEIITNYTDWVSTQNKTFTFPKVQSSVRVKNQGNTNLSYTIGSKTGTLAPNQSVTVNEKISSYTLSAASGTHTFEVFALEDGTEKQEQDNSGDIASLTTQLADIVTVNDHLITYGYDANGNVQTVTEKDVNNNTIKTVTYTYNAVGDVSQSVTVMNGKTVTTTYNYDSTTGNITSTSNVIS